MKKIKLSPYIVIMSSYKKIKNHTKEAGVIALQAIGRTSSLIHSYSYSYCYLFYIDRIGRSQ